MPRLQPGELPVLHPQRLRNPVQNPAQQRQLVKPTNNTNWPGLATYAQDIRATLRWTGNKVYFFFANGTYSRYDLVNKSVDSGYPKAINNSTWPGLGNYATEITEAVKWNNTRAYFFLTGQRYLRYSITNDSVDAGYPAAVNNTTWPGLLNP